MKNIIGNVICDTAIKVDNGLKRLGCTCDIDNTIPTMIVGVQNAKKLIPDFNILTKKVKNRNLWWTFKRNERLLDYKKDMEFFYKECLEQLTSSIQYSFIDVMSLTLKKTKKILKYLQSETKKYYYIDYNKFIFVFDPSLQKIWGFSLTTSEFCGLSKNKILNFISHNTNNILINNFNNIPFNVRNLVGDEVHKLIILYEHFE